MAEAAFIVVSSSEPSVVVSQKDEPAPVRTVGTPGQRGPRGIKGERGDRGFSAYETWLEEGNSGTEQEFLASLIGGNFVHDQMSPSTVWTITHNLGFFPNVTAFDSAGTEIVGQVTYNTQDSITITFSSSNAGKAYLS